MRSVCVSIMISKHCRNIILTCRALYNGYHAIVAKDDSSSLLLLLVVLVSVCVLSSVTRTRYFVGFGVLGSNGVNGNGGTAGFPCGAPFSQPWSLTPIGIATGIKYVHIKRDN